MTLTNIEITRYKFKLPVGDWSMDGHSICDYFVVTALKDWDGAKAAWEKALELLPELNPQKFCNEYEDAIVPDRIKGLDLDSMGVHWIQEDWDGNDLYFNPENMAQYVVWYINQGDPELDLQLDHELNHVRELYFAGTGYGLFSL